MDKSSDTPVSRGFYLKFSPSDPRDIQLSHWIREDTEGRRVNISGVVKALLYEWYELRLQMGRLPTAKVVDLEAVPLLALSSSNGRVALPAPNDEGMEDPNDPLVKQLAGTSFDNHDWS